MSVDFSENFMHTTTIIQGDNGSVGTGFFYEIPIPEISPNHNLQFIATNKHVVNGESFITATISTQDEFGRPIYNNRMAVRIELTSPNTLFDHPDTNIDLCLINITDILEAFHSQGTRLYFLAFSPSTIPTREQLQLFNALEDVVMVGYPSGLWDDTNNLPIMRKGVTASHISFDFKGLEVFLADIACYRGSSGSPLFIHNNGMLISRKSWIFNEAPVLLVGIAFRIPTEISIGNIVPIDIPTTVEEEEQRAVIENDLNLGYFIKSYKLLDFVPMMKGLLNLTN